MTKGAGDWFPKLSGRLSVPRSEDLPDGAAFPRGGTLFSEPILVVNQKPKFVELTNEYAIFDQGGQQVAAVREVGQSRLKKLVRALSGFDQYFRHQLQIADMQGNTLLMLTRPRTFTKSRIVVQDATGNEVGAIVQQNLVGKIRFALDSGGQTVGSINAENWSDWDFSIRDPAETEVARVSKSMVEFIDIPSIRIDGSTPDDYLVVIHRPLQSPLRELVIAAALSIDTALNQRSR